MAIEITCGDQVKRPVTEADEQDLRWWVANGKKDFIVEACRAELATRSGGPAPAPRAALAKVNASEIVQLCGAIESAADAATRLAKLTEIGHLVSPAPMVGRLPEGCSLTVSAILIDTDRETYPNKGSSDRGLHKVALDKIAGAAGVQWDALQTKRLDNGIDPWYCRFQVVGKVRNFDLSWRQFLDHKELDLRDGAPIVEEIIERETRKKKLEGDKYKGDLGAADISMKRRHIQSLCITEARLRAVRSGLGLRTGYSVQELAKPFFIVALTFDGRSDDPEARREFRQMIGRSMLGDGAVPGAAEMLYGKGVVPALPRAAEDDVGHAPPPVGQTLESSGVEVPSDEEEEGPPARKSAGGERY